MLRLVEHTRPQARKDRVPHSFAIVIVDMQCRPNECNMAYRHGSFDDGIGRLCHLLKLARKFDIPVILVESEESGKRTLAPILARIPFRTKAVIKGGTVYSAFGEPSFQPLLTDLGIKTLVLCGYHRDVCVRATANDALALGYSLITSDHLMFGSGGDLLFHIYRGLPPWHFYRQKTEYYDTFRGVLAAIGQRVFPNFNNHQDVTDSCVSKVA
jgi:hypothetical protein